MTLPEKTQQEISELFEATSRYFSSAGISQNYYENSNNEPTGLQKSLDIFQSKKKKKRTTLVETFIDDLKEQIGHKESEVEMLKDQLTLYDLKIDQYDVIINNIDKAIIPLIDEINVGIASVKTAYDNRVAAGCKSDLYWELTDTTTYLGVIDYGVLTVDTYTCKKNPSVREDYNYYGAKYYRKPQNQDYGANIVTEFLGSIGIGKTILGIVGFANTLQFQIGDKVLDNIDNPVVFSSNNIPTILSFGTTSLVGATTSFGGTISSGSTIIAHTGIGTTTDINIGDAINLTNVLPINTKVVGFGTTTITLTNIWNPNANGPGSGAFISTMGQTNSLIISVAAIGSTTTGTFTVGLLTSYPAIILDTQALQDVKNTNFTLIRDTQTTPTEFDYTNNPIDPVTVGIMGNSSIGLGHKLTLVNNGSPVGPFQWHEVRGAEFAPEPPCGASYARYYPGNNSWPGVIDYTYDIDGIFASQSFSYASEGQTVSVSVGSTPKFGAGTTSTSALNPSVGTCNALTAIITAAEASRDAIISKNISKIQGLIASGNSLRNVRDKLESRAFAILQGRVSADVEINKLKQDLAALQNTDYSAFEPDSYYFNPDTGKTSTSTLGVATS
jgi:hypothetical protein